jgi:predicted glycoside hydrolase/deacetylase ChbG (UPF0249 family)
MSERVIRHADDMGATVAMSRRIADAWQRGLLDGFSVMGNGDGLDELARAFDENHGRSLRLAAHLNLSEGRPLMPPEAVPMLVGAHNHLRHTFGSLLALWLKSSQENRRRLLQQVEAEWRAQLRHVVTVARGRRVNALDSHIHLHMLPFLFPVAVQLAREHEIEEVRVTAEPFHLSAQWRDSIALGFAVNLVKHVVLRHCARRAANHLRGTGVRGPDCLIGVLYTGRMSADAARAGLAAARRAGASTVELLFHIGRADQGEKERWVGNSAVGAFPLSAERDREFAELIRLATDE